MTPEELLQEGLRLLEDGYSLIPVCGKVPNGEWKPCLDGFLSPTALKALLVPNGHGPVTGLATVIGPATWKAHPFLYIQEIESRHRPVAEPWLDKHLPGWRAGLVAESGAGSLHLYLTSPRPVVTAVHAWGECRGKGSITVRPGAIHPDTGRPYRWLSEGRPIRVDPAGVPFPARSQSRRTYQDLAEGVLHEHEGRNLALTSLAGLMRSVGFSMSVLSEAVRAVNLKCCAPPVGDKELSGILVSISKYERGTRLDKIMAAIDNAQPAAQAEQALAETNKLQGAKMRALLSRKLRPEAPVLVALTDEIVQGAQGGKADAAGYVPVTSMHLADRAGVSVNAAARHLKKSVEIGLFERRYEREFGRVVDTDTGEVRTEVVTRAFYRLPYNRDLVGQLKAIAEFTPGPGEERNHGGVRSRCKLHPNALIISGKFCGECGELLEVAEIDPNTGKREPVFEINPPLLPRKRARRAR